MWEIIKARVPARGWLTAAAGSLAVLLLLLSQVDFKVLGEALEAVMWPWFALSIVLLMAEGFATAKRMQVCTPGPPPYPACLKISAWFVLYLIVLPARIGEVVAVVLLRTYAGQSSGPALANLLTQRLFDLLVLIAAFVLLALIVSGLPLGWLAFTAAALLFALLGALIIWLEELLAVAAVLLRAAYQRFGKRGLKSLCRLVLQARSWRRHHASRAVLLRAIMITLLKWSANLGGLTLLFVALNFPITIAEAVLLAAAFNFLAIVPVQTIGGIGVSEIGLAGLLVAFGTSVEYAAGMGIVVRAVLILTPPLYWVLIMGLLATVPVKTGLIKTMP